MSDYLMGTTLKRAIDLVIDGDLRMFPDEVELFVDAVTRAGGHHVEVGTAWGGSAILASLCTPGIITCIDPLTGYYGSEFDGGAKHRFKPTPELVLENASRFGRADRFRIIAKKSQPFPQELEGDEWASAYIDGDHSGPAVMSDCKALMPRVKMLIFHDAHKDTVGAAIKHALESGWERTAETWRLAVLERGA